MRGLLWSHVLASVCGGLVVAGVLLGFGVIGKQRTETVPINYSAPPTTVGDGSAQTDNTEQLYSSNAPGVVYITAKVLQRTTSPFIAGTEPASSISSGSGFLIASKASKGYILTSFHLIQGADYTRGITVAFNSETSRQAKVLEFNQTNDVALLQVDMKGVPAQIQPLSLGNSRSVEPGDSTLTISNPFGLERTLSTGIVSSLQPKLTGADGASIDDVIQTDTPTSPGSSGGPLLNASGEVIGVNSQIEVNSGGTNYLVGFAVPIETVRQIIPDGVLR
jgi:S1-C subfamily serine protease